MKHKNLKKKPNISKKKKKKKRLSELMCNTETESIGQGK